MVTVKVVASGGLTEEVVGAHGVVVMCGQPGEDVAKWDAFCHEKVPFVCVCGCIPRNLCVLFVSPIVDHIYVHSCSLKPSSRCAGPVRPHPC